MTFQFIKILDVPFINTTRRAFIQTLQNRIDNKEKTFVVTANPEIVMQTLDNQEYKKTLQKADFITADGIGIVKAAQLIGQPLPERVSGFDLMLDLLEIANEKRYRVFFLGAADHVLQQTLAKVKTDFPGIQIAGAQNGFFDWKDPVLPQMIKDSKSDLVFVALGFPRQENWIGSHINLFNQGVFIGIGGSFDGFTGNVKRAPEVWQKLNLEWFYRLVKQPSRWKRMLVLPKFAITVMRKKAMNKR